MQNNWFLHNPCRNLNRSSLKVKQNDSLWLWYKLLKSWYLLFINECCFQMKYLFLHLNTNLFNQKWNTCIKLDLKSTPAYKFIPEYVQWKWLPINISIAVNSNIKHSCLCPTFESGVFQAKINWVVNCCPALPSNEWLKLGRAAQQRMTWMPWIPESLRKL